MAVKMNGVRDHDECLERLWHLRERGIRTWAGAEGVAGVEEPAARGLAREGLATLADDGGFSFTEAGEQRARRLVRAHRIAERLVHDILGSPSESVACEFEHLVNTEVADAICTLLGHPRECPHGYPIPEGECCRRSDHVVRQRVVPLTELELGQSGRVAYVYARTDPHLHALDSLQVRPGVVVTLHQRYPSYVIECEGGSIALDESVARSINVWALQAPLETPAGAADAASPGRRRFRWGMRTR